MLVIDCGSGGTRICRKTKKGVERLKWPKGRAPVLSNVLPSDERRRDFASDINALAAPCLIGATAGLRYALLTGTVSEADIEALRELLPENCTFQILSPLEEAQLELASLLFNIPDAVTMISMGGKSMQIGCEANLFSLPFAMHLGYGMLKKSRNGPWRERVAAAAHEYEAKCDEAAENDRIALLDGTIWGVTDTVDVAISLKIVNRSPMPVGNLIEALDACATYYTESDPLVLDCDDMTLLARVLALRTVAKKLKPSCAISFRSDFGVTWAEGYLHGTPRPLSRPPREPSFC
mmetsp:Transcript_50225/g.58627  ORF Transcript_50225/g.58627 Transcript_50225/m.58627 type:complete len:293 (+) Transcript_50225:38-916(+)